MNVLERNKTWENVDKLKYKIIVGCEWIYRVKYWFDGTWINYKASQIAKKYTQTIRYMCSTMRRHLPYLQTWMLSKLFYPWHLTLCGSNNNYMLKMHSCIETLRRCMEIPTGYDSTNGGNKVCWLRMAFYGLK